MPQRRKRRTEAEQIADLQVEIKRLKERAAQKKVKADPGLRHISAALKSIEKAAEATNDKATGSAIDDARATLAACLGLHGVSAPGATQRRRKAATGDAPDTDAVLRFIELNLGTRSQDICAELDTDSATLRPVLHALRDDGKIETEGKARAMRYRAVG